MKHYLVLVVVIVVIIVMLPVIALMSSTNLAALNKQNSINNRLFNISIFTANTVAGDLYDYGECTYWAALRRIQIHKPIPNTWGNAITWAERAKQDGYLVNHIPSFGAIMQNSYAPGGLGHVAFVESVNPLNGDWTISEMNNVGWDEVDEQTFSPTQALMYDFIH